MRVSFSAGYQRAEACQSVLVIDHRSNVNGSMGRSQAIVHVVTVCTCVHYD